MPKDSRNMAKKKKFKQKLGQQIRRNGFEYVPEASLKVQIIARELLRSFSTSYKNKTLPKPGVQKKNNFEKITVIFVEKVLSI